MRTAARVAQSVVPKGGRAYTAAIRQRVADMVKQGSQQASPQAYTVPYKQRFNVVSKGVRLGKAQTLEGVWHGANDTQSLARLWPTKLGAAEAKAAVILFDSILTKTGKKSAALGKAGALLTLGDFPAARSIVTTSGIAAGDAEYPAYLALKASIACAELSHIATMEEADPSFTSPNKPHLEQEASESFVALTSYRPECWASPLAHGEFLVRKNDKAAVGVLREALTRVLKEINGRQGKSAGFVSNRDSASALADYVDYKYTVDFTSDLADVLLTDSTRTDPVMEQKLNSAYPGLTPREIVAAARLDSDIEAGAYTFNLGWQPVEILVNPWTSPQAMQVTGLLEKYTGGKLGAVQRGTAPGDLDAQLDAIKCSSDAVNLESVIDVQHELAAVLAKQVGYKCKVLLAEALLLAHSPQEAHAMANDVVCENAYLQMYSALRARAQASNELGDVESAGKDFQKAFGLENAFEDADIPTMDKAAYREEF